MKKIIITDYYDFNFPSELISEDNLVFHGTGKSMGDLIEEQGFIGGVKPFEISDIRFLIESHQLLGYGKHVMPITVPNISNKPTYNTGYWSLATFVLAGHKWRGFKDLTLQYPSVTYNYWQAGNYSTKQGGETIRIINRAISELLSLLKSDEKLKQHKNEIKTKSLLANFDGDEPSDSILKRLDDSKFLKQICLKLENLLNKKILILPNETYRTIFENHFPEIFAIRIDPKKLAEKKDEFSGFTNDLFATVDIPTKDIVARISFEKGHKIPTAWDIISNEIKNLNSNSVKKLNINEDIVSKYGKNIEDSIKGRQIFSERERGIFRNNMTDTS